MLYGYNYISSAVILENQNLPNACWQRADSSAVTLGSTSDTEAQYKVLIVMKLSRFAFK
jgi:hypothetical protein